MSNILQAVWDMDEKESTVTVEQVLKVLKQHTFGVVVAGGYARDKFYGAEPKDIDICVYNYHHNDYAERVLFNSALRELRALTVVNDITQQHDYEDGLQDGRLYAVYNLPHLGADLIIYNAKTHQEVLGMFDCNVNQFYFPSTVPDFDSEATYSPTLEEQPVHISGKQPEELVFLRPDSTGIDRMVYMVDKVSEFIDTTNALCDVSNLREASLAKRDDWADDIPFNN